MNAHVALKPVSKRVMTHGQALLAHSAAQDLVWELYLATLGYAGEPNREVHVSRARAELERIAKRMGLMLVPAPVEGRKDG